MVYSPVMGGFKLSAQDMGAPDYAQALQKGFQTAADVYKPRQASEKLLEQMIKNKFLPRSEEARIHAQESNTGLDPYRAAQMQANTDMLGENTLKQKILNGFLPEHEKASINKMNATSDYYKSGGGSKGVGGQAELSFINNVALDNPELSESEVRDAANAIRSGKSTLEDGRYINATPTTMASLDRTIKAGTTAGLLNSGVKANQGEAELQALDKYQSTLPNPYKSTLKLPFIGEFSPEMMKDSIDPSDAAQTRLGQAIGLQALNYEKSQLRNNVAGGMPGITAINVLMQHSGQVLPQNYPQIKGKAREVADKVISDGIENMRKARMKSGFSPSSLIPKTETTAANNKSAVSMYKNGVLHFIPLNDAKEAESLGYTYE